MLKTKKDNFIVQGSILAIAGIFVRIIGLIYRIPLTRIVGEEGMGYYSQAFNIYSVTLLLSSYSLPLAVSKMISARIGKRQYKNAGRILSAALVYATIVGFIGFSFIWFLADFLAKTVFNMPPAAIALKALAPTIWVMAYLGVYRGYYQGHSTMIPTAISQIIEQIINAIVSVFAASYLKDMAIEQSKTLTISRAYGAAGGTIGTGAGAFAALISLLLLFIFGFKSRKKRINSDESIELETYSNITAVLFYTVIPVIASTAIYNINSIIDGAIFGHSMAFLGLAADTAKEYGIYTSKYLILINVPVAIANSLSSSLIPELSKASAGGDRVRVNSSIAVAIRFAMLVSAPAAVGLAVLAKPIISLLFGTSIEAVSLMQVGSIAVILYSVSTVSNAILQGTNNMNLPVRNAAMSLAIHIVFLLVFLNVFSLGTYGLVFANILFALLICIFNALSIKNRLLYKQEIFKTYVMPLICSLLMGAVIFLVYTFLDKFIRSNLVSSIIPMLVAILIYPILLILTRTLTKEELLLMPKGRKLVGVLSKLRLM